MRGTCGLLITLFVLLSPADPSLAQNIRAAGVAKGGIRGAGVRATSSQRQIRGSNFRGRFSKLSSSSSFSGRSERLDHGMANSTVTQFGSRENFSRAGSSFGLSSNLTGSTLGRTGSRSNFQPIPEPPDSNTAPVKRSYMGSASSKPNSWKPKFNPYSSKSRTVRNHPSPYKITNLSSGLNRPVTVGRAAPPVARGSNSNRNGNLRGRSTGRTIRIDPPANIPIAPARNTGMVYWVDRNKGIKHFSNNLHSIPEETKAINLADDRRLRIESELSDWPRNLEDSPRGLGRASFTSKDINADLVMQKTVDFPGQSPGVIKERYLSRRNIQKADHGKPFHHDRGHAMAEGHHLRHHHFHHRHFFPFNPFFFSNSFFFFGTIFPQWSFCFVNYPFILQPVFPCPFFGFQPVLLAPAPTFLFPVFPQFTAYNPFINPFLANPFCDPFWFGTDFFFNSIAFYNFL